MNFYFKYKKLLNSILVLIAAIGIWLVYALAGLRAYEVVYEKPPAFVDTYAKQLATSESGAKALSAPLSGPLSKKDKNIDFSKEEALMHRVFFEGESLDLILPLFTYPEKAQRVKVASAFAAFNIEFTHNEESGYPDIRRQFWLDAKAHMPDIENALYEALITSAEEGRKNRIPYTIAWLPGQDQKTVELLTWAAQHHSDWWVRRFSVYFVIKFGQNEEFAQELLQKSVHDPDYRVRKQVLDLKMERLKTLFVGTSEA